MTNKSISQAFVKFQASVKPIYKNKDVKSGSYSYTYAEFSEIVQAIQPKLTENGLAFRQKAVTTPDMVSVQTMLVHESGEEWDCGTFSLPITDRNPQKLGGLLTYCRRYSLTTGLGIVVSDSCEADNDANNDDAKITRKYPSKYGSNNQKSSYSANQYPKSNLKNESAQETDLDCKPDNTLERKRFFAICNKKQIGEKKQRAICYAMFGKESRATLDHDEFRYINQWLQDAAKEDILGIVNEAVRMKLGLASNG